MARKLKDTVACLLILTFALKASLLSAFAGDQPPALPDKIREADEAIYCDRYHNRDKSIDAIKNVRCGDRPRDPAGNSGAGSSSTNSAPGTSSAGELKTSLIGQDSLIGLSGEARARPRIVYDPTSKQDRCSPGNLTEKLRESADCPCDSRFSEQISWITLPPDNVGYYSYESQVGTPFTYHDALAMDLAVQECNNIFVTGYGEGSDINIGAVINAYVARLTGPNSVSVRFLPAQLSTDSWWNFQSHGMSVRVNTNLVNRLEVAGDYREAYSPESHGFVWRDPFAPAGGQFSLTDFGASHSYAVAEDSLMLSGSPRLGGAAVSAAIGQGQVSIDRLGAQWSPSGTTLLHEHILPGSLPVLGDGSAFEGTRLALTSGITGRLYASATHRLNPSSGATSRAARLTLTAQAGEPVEVRMSDVAGRPVATAYSISPDGRLVVGQASEDWVDGDQTVRRDARAFVWDATPTGTGNPPPSLPPSLINPPEGSNRITAWAIATENPTLAYVVGSYKNGFDELTRLAYVAVCTRPSAVERFKCGTPNNLKELLRNDYDLDTGTSILSVANAVVFKSGLLWIAGYGYQTDATTEGFKPFVVAIAP